MISLTEGDRKSHNPFSKIVGDLREKKEKLIKDNEQEYQDRLEQAEEILVGDCFEAIAGITPQAFMKSGRVSFESEAFLWFKDGKKNLMGEVEDPTVEVVKKIASGIKSQAKKKPIRNARSEAQRKVFSSVAKMAKSSEINPFASSRSVKFLNNDLDKIYQRVGTQLLEEYFLLNTSDGTEFTLAWSE